MRVLGEYVLVKKAAEQEKTASGIVVPLDDSKAVFEVTGVGPDVKGCKVGDKVLAIERFGIAEVDGVEYHIFKQEDLVAVI